MKNYMLGALLALTLLATGALSPSAGQAGPSALSSPIIHPTPKWQYKGCFSSWCQTGWYASPAVADLNGDGKPEVIWSPYSIFVVDAPPAAQSGAFAPATIAAAITIPPAMSAAHGRVLWWPISMAMARPRS